MHKTLEALSALLLAALYGMTYAAMYGPRPLPARIATHFDAAGLPNGWGAPQTLWTPVFIATGVFLLFTLAGNVRARRYNLPVDVTDANRPYVQAQTALAMAWLKNEVLCLFLVLQRETIAAAQSQLFRPRALLAIPVAIAVILRTALWRMIVLVRGAKARLNPASERPLSLDPQ